MDKRPNKEESTGIKSKTEPVESQQESNDTARASSRRPFTKPVLKKFRQIDYVATYGSK